MSTSAIKWCVVFGLYFLSSLGSRTPKVKYAGRYDIRENVLNFHEFEIILLDHIVNNVHSRAFQITKHYSQISYLLLKILDELVRRSYCYVTYYTTIL